MIYCDSAYLLKFYIREPGSDEVRALFEENDIASCAHARLEIVAAIHRKWREGLITKTMFQQIVEQFQSDTKSDSWTWYSIDESLLASTEAAYRTLSPTVFLRASDALHLACAKEHGFREIYSNDARLLAAAKHFGIKGRNVIK